MSIRMNLFVALAAVVYGGMAFGQATSSADVTGTVTDTSGAVIPGVTVTVKDLDKGAVRTVTTNQSGSYDTGPIVPEDNYTVVFTRDGFESLQRGPMVLNIGLTGLNVQLGIGKATQQVVVNEAPPLLETTTAELSSTLPTETLQELPQTAGTPDWQSFLVLMPGTSGVAQNGNSASNPGMGGVAANGSMPFSTAMLDGSTVSSPMSDNVINTPIFDTIGEVKMSDSSFSAQYGTGGVIYNQISKGGSNTIHGLAYEYFRNTALNAANYAFGTGTVPVIHWNDFGFQVSGPIIKNKIFALFDWDHTINHGGASETFATVPTAAMLSGDFTGLPTIYDPSTQVVTTVGGQQVVTRQSFESEYGNGNKIPAGMIDPVAKAIQAIFPTINTPFASNDYSYISPSSSTLQKWFGRFDADVTSKNHISGSSAYNYTLITGASPDYPVNATNVDVENMSGQLSDVHTFSARTINEARAGWMGEYDLLTSPTIGEGWPEKLGLQFAHADIFPTININGFTGLGCGGCTLGPGIHANYRENVFDESDVVTMIRGRHTLHFGGEMVAFRADSTAWGNINAANLGFTGVYTEEGNGAATAIGGSPYADFLLGYTQNWSASVSPTYYGRLKNPAVFVQDDYKVSPKLTLNLGLRWEGRTGWSDATKNERAFDPTITNPATNTPGAMWYAATHVNGRTQLQQNQWDNWLPRVGAAYQLGSKMTIRGGFGIYTFPWNVDNYAGCCLGDAISSSGSAADVTGGVAPVVVLSSSGGVNYQGAAGASINSLYVAAPTTPQAYNGQAVSYMQYNQPIPRLYSWNLTVQRQIGNMVGSVGYVGSHANNLIFNTDLNQVPESELGPNDASLRPYPEYQAISGFTTQASSFYSALQAEIKRNFTNGLMFDFNYTWSHMTDSQDSSGWGSKEGNTIWQNAYSPSANHGAANFDVRDMFKAYGSYELPFGRGRRYLNNNRVLDETVGGWMFSATFIGQGGNPFTPVMVSSTNSYASTPQANGFFWFPNQVGDPKANTKGINGWFNVDAFASPAPGTLGDTRRNSVYGPGVVTVNASIKKTFPIWERVGFEFSADATNALNHPAWGQPDTDIGPGHTGQIRSVTVGGRNIELIGKLRF
jgi:hypothetical protein